MVQLDILSGKKAGAHWLARRLPVHIGRAPGNELQLDDDGVWDRHLTLEFRRREGFFLTADAKALAAVNGEAVQSALLHNGDVITLGSAKLQFWLAPGRQQGVSLREFFVWALVAGITALQFALIYWLVR